MKQEEMIGLLYKLSTTLMTEMNNELRKHHLTFQQYQILVFLKQQEREVIGKDICLYLGLSHPTVVGLVSRMVTNNLVMVHTSLHDRRQTAIEISQYGEELIETVREEIEKINQKICLLLGKKETDQLMKLLLKLEKCFEM